MSILYVGNCTRQRNLFQYRIAGKPEFILQEIPPRHQTAISVDSPVEVESIIEAHAPYGMRAVSEIDRLDAFTGLVYSLDKQIPGHKLTAAAEHNLKTLEKQGEINRAQAALAAAQVFEGAEEQSGIKTNNLTVVAQELATGTSDDTGFVDSIHLERADAVQASAKRRGRPPKSA